MKIDNRIWTIITVVVIAGLFVAGWFLGAQPSLAQVAADATQRAAAAAQNEQLQAQLDALEAAKADLPELQAQAEEFAKAIPADTQSSAFILGLNNLAASSGVVIDAITISDARKYELPPTSVIEAPSDEPTDGATEGAAPPPPPKAPDGAADPYTDGLITSKNFVVVPISIDVTGPWQNTLNFIKGLQSGERLMLVTALEAALNSDGTFKTTITGTIYVLLDPNRPATELDSDAPGSETIGTPAPSDTPIPSDTAVPGATPSPSATVKN